ncbi:glycosyl hydrolase [Gallaecimonas mangrovi]|uniref:glycosyl hydrolase n=1 Tax=Gallaecimonas mangrovi TaxID=2291597 RepID=UPI000E20B68F|nr:glycosyl hydrolase [Gallaecimonas mangrovi]
MKTCIHWALLAMAVASTQAQADDVTAIAAGKGSYASAPLSSEGVDDFVNNQTIYVAPGETRPIPTNDWWTDLVVSQYGGELWAYPLVLNPESDGMDVQFPIAFNSTGTDAERGPAITVGGTNFAPTEAYAKDWDDWMVTAAMPDGDKEMDVKMAHGIPFAWFTTTGFTPAFTFASNAEYVDADGDPANFPVTGGAFAVEMDGRYFGIHLGNDVTAQITGRQWVEIDLGTSQPISEVKLNWETAYASGYAIQVSDDDQNWSTVYSTSAGDGAEDDIPNLDAQGRYIRIEMLAKGSIYAYSLWEFQVYNGTSLISQDQPATASSTQSPWAVASVNDGNTGTRWASDPDITEQLTLSTNSSGDSHFVISALPTLSDLTTYDQYAHNVPQTTRISYSYDPTTAKVVSHFDVTAVNSEDGSSGATIQGFLPHQYKNTDSDVSYTGESYVTPRGALKTAIGNDFSFSYLMPGLLPNFTPPYAGADANPYDSTEMYNLITQFAKQASDGSDTYWGGKDLVNLAKYTLMAKQLNHQAYSALAAKTKAALVDWLTYTPGETERYFARYARWGAMVGFNSSYGSEEFTDNHFHYGYLITAAAIYGLTDPQFLKDYGPMLTLVAKQYANWDRTDTQFPYFRTFDPWIGHSYAGGLSSATGNNQESSSEAMQSWVGLFLLGSAMGDDAMRDAGAYGWVNESAATLEYWFDWDHQNLPASYQHSMVGILWAGGYSYGTYFGASPVYIHGIQYLPINPGFRYLARNPTWAASEYNALLTEANEVDGFSSEADFGSDWAQVALGFELLFNPSDVTAKLADYIALDNGILSDVVSGITYYYAHAMQNLGDFSRDRFVDLPMSSVFDKNGVYTYTAYNPTDAAVTAHVYEPGSSAVLASFTVPANGYATYPAQPTAGVPPADGYQLTIASASASSGDASLAIDGNAGSRWESDFSDPQYLELDLGVACDINKMVISWEVANGKHYVLQGSNDNSTWTAIKTVDDDTEGNRTDSLDDLSGSYRYLRIYGTERNTQYGYSIYEVSVYGKLSD